MKLKLTDKEFEKLIVLVTLGDWIVNGVKIDDERTVEDRDYKRLVDRLYSLVKGSGLKIEKYFKEYEQGGWDTTMEFYDKFLEKHLEVYDEELFWQELEGRLADREWFKEHRFDKKMDDKNRLSQIWKIEEKLGEDFENNGLDNIRWQESELKREEVVLPPIKLKYFERTRDGRRVAYVQDKCLDCKQKGGVLGGVEFDEVGNPKQICEECFVKRLMKKDNIESKDVALSRKNRNYDVMYLFLEKMMDQYMEKEGVKDVEKIDQGTLEKMLTVTKEVYNRMFSKNEKEDLEYTVEQAEIEKTLDRTMDSWVVKELVKRIK